MNELYGAFIEVCDSVYRDLIPRNIEKQKFFLPQANVHKKCMEKLLEKHYVNSEDIEDKEFETQQEKEIAKKFFKGIFWERRRPKYYKQPNLEIFTKKLKEDIEYLSELMKPVLSKTGNRDLIKLDQSADLISKYNGSEKTYAFLYVLSRMCDEKNKELFKNSRGYQELIKWGATPFLDDFWPHFQKRFKITRTAIKSEAAQNLARGWGESESNMKEQIQALNQKIDELERVVQETKLSAYNQAIIQVGRKLQNRPAPTLDQAFALYQKLKNRSLETDLSNELLGVLIVLEDIIEAFNSLGIQIYPENCDEEIIITDKELSEYQYIRGSAFSSEKYEKHVRCTKQGWRAVDTIITPAQVEEIMKGDVE